MSKHKCFNPLGHHLRQAMREKNKDRQNEKEVRTTSQKKKPRNTEQKRSWPERKMYASPEACNTQEKQTDKRARKSSRTKTGKFQQFQLRVWEIFMKKLSREFTLYLRNGIKVPIQTKRIEDESKKPAGLSVLIGNPAKEVKLEYNRVEDIDFSVVGEAATRAVQSKLQSLIRGGKQEWVRRNKQRKHSTRSDPQSQKSSPEQHEKKPDTSAKTDTPVSGAKDVTSQQNREDAKEDTNKHADLSEREYAIVMLLKEREYASYNEIADALTQNGITCSSSTVGKDMRSLISREHVEKTKTGYTAS